MVEEEEESGTGGRFHFEQEACPLPHRTVLSESSSESLWEGNEEEAITGCWSTAKSGTNALLNPFRDSAGSMILYAVLQMPLVSLAGLGGWGGGGMLGLFLGLGTGRGRGRDPDWKGEAGGAPGLS